jgi:hypothetical protein
MSESKILHAAMDAFEQNFTAMCRDSGTMFDKVDEKIFSTLTATLMSAARAAGAAGLTEFLRENDTVCPTIVRDDRSYRYKGTCTNELLTLFGTISVDRSMYYDEKNGGEYFFPLDNALGIEKDDFATLDTREMILFASASCVPRELAQILEKCSLCKPSRTAIQNIINRDGLTMETMRGQLAQKVYDEQVAPKETKAFVVSLDGVNVLLREEGKKKGRKNKRPTDNPVQEKTTSYHNAMVGAVSFYGINDENKPDRIRSIYTARMPQEKSTDFKCDFERMVTTAEDKISAIGTPPIPRILLTDGHLMIKGFAKESLVLRPYEKLLDFYHATEHLSKGAEAMYGEQTDLSKAYYNKWRNRLKTDPDAPSSIMRSLRSFLQRKQLSAKRKTDLKTECTFFRKNRKLMKYYDFLERGLPIGSGPIEAAAKTIVRQRMCRSGMSWSREKGQYILTVRAYVQSGLWDNAWKHFKIVKKSVNVYKWAA